ncbi:MAG: hypothetical protein LBJ33_00830 [Pseudomonas putida]|jgi:hypothetical protein|nr:hypothetical protein [Pseudomonas putida]
MPNDDLGSTITETYWQEIKNPGTPSQSLNIVTGEEAITIYQDVSCDMHYCIGRSVFLAAGQDVTIHASRVYVMGLSSFPGQTVTIHAREIGSVGPSGVAAVLSVDGTPGPLPKPRVPNQDPPGTRGSSSSNGEQPPPTAGGTGTSGASGGDGAAGTAAGRISLFCDAILPDTCLQLSAVGGDGGAGQDGQDGAQGGPGGNSVHYCMAPSGDGGTGGTGGVGGVGGPGGAGGMAELFCVTPLPSTAVVSVNTSGGSGGAGGAGGEGGPGGVPGTVESVMPGYVGKNGSQGQSGAVGSAGPTGQAGPQNVEATGAGYVPTPPFTIASYVAGLDPSQCSMVMEKTLLLYLQADGSKADPLFAEVYDALSWYASLYDQLSATLSEPLKSILAQASGYLVQLNAKLDVYGRPYNYVPLVSYNEYNSLLPQQLALFTVIETAFDGYFSSLQAQQASTQTVQACITQAQTAISNNQAKCQALLNDASELVPSIEVAEIAVEQAKAALETALANLQEKIQDSVGCPLASILQSVAMSVLTGGKVTPASLISAALQASKAYNPNIVPAGPSGAISTMYLVSQVQFVESDLQSIKEGYQSLNGLITEADPNAARLVQLETQFNQLYTQYFAQWQVGQEAEQAFEAYVQAVQYRNHLISNYNDDYTQACTLFQRAQSLQQLIQVAQNSLMANNDSTLPEIVTFMSHAYHQARSEMIHTLYLTSRAQQFWAIAPYDGLRALIGLDDPSQINTATLTVAQNLLLTNFENAITQGQEAETFSALQLVISDSATLAAFRENPQLLIPIAPAMTDTPLSPVQPFAGLANVRLTTVRAYVKGASTSDGSLRVSLMHGGYETVVSPTNLAMSFIHKPLSVMFQYDLAVQDTILIDGTIGSSTLSDNYALIGPFTTWSVKVDPGLNPGLDLSQVSSITIEFSGTFNAFPR